MGKAVSWVVKKDIVEAVGTLQTCAGMESGIEGAIHAVKRGWDKPGCEAVLLVDADNAFNHINRKVSLENTKSLCPPLHKYLLNCYNTPARLLYLKDLVGHIMQAWSRIWAFGYHPKPAKTILILKDETLMPKALEIFGDTGI